MFSKGNKKMTKRTWTMLLTLSMVFALLLSACAGAAPAPATDAPAADAPAADAPAADAPATDGEVKLVGISMPTQSSSRWISDGENMVKVFEAAGYDTNLQFAEDDIPTQLTQIESMVANGADVLVIAAIDGATLTDVLQKAKDAGILVMAYDRLLVNTDNVDYYSTFDNFQVGVLQAQQIVDALDLENAAGPFNIELFGGSPDDTNAYYFYDGAMSVLQPFIDSGKLVVAERADGHGHGLHAALGRRHCSGAHGQPAQRLLRRQAGRRRALAV
jgi:putative multiple sugar transport system substrate-binding protein